MSAGELRERLRFEERPVLTDDGFGNRERGWRIKFEEFARVRPMTGSEPIIAARLAGVQTVRLTVRSNAKTRDITTGWRAVDMRDEKLIFNITAPPANLDERNRWLDIMAQIGTPT